MIDWATTEKIKEAAQIVDVVSDFVALKKSGANYKGLCPFHDDRTPSFMVSPAKNYCKCFACGKGGYPIGFIMELEQMSYPDALRFLAKKYGIAIEERELTQEERDAQSEKESMYILNQWASEWFQKKMNDTLDGRAVGMAYFRERGFRDDIIKKFQLGFCPDKWGEMSHDALKEGYKEQFLIATGLSLKRDDGSLYDRFRGRVIFPWHTVSGKVCGFGGRVLDAATKGVAVKYQNSPESQIYSKRKELYGLYYAKQAINKHDMVYMVEGYTDVISMHQCGIENVVANSGTALTKEQIYLLHRFTNNITLLYDGDSAGIHAAQRGTDMFLAAGMNVRILLLPDGDDPDSFARKHNADGFRKYIEEHQSDFIRFKTDLLLNEANGDPVKLSSMVNEIVASIAVIPDEVKRMLYMRQAAQMLQIEEQILQRAIQNQMSRNREDDHKKRIRQSSLASPDSPNTMIEEKATVAQQPTPIISDKDNLTDNPETKAFGHVSNMDKIELLLAQMIVRHGHEILCNLEDENGENMPLTVTEFICFSLSQDGLALRNQIAARIMSEAMQHVKEEGFNSENFFIDHEDRSLSQTAFNLITEIEQFGRTDDDDSGQASDSPSGLLEQVSHLLADMKQAIVRSQINQIMKDINNPAVGKEQGLELLRQLKELKDTEKRLAKECGDKVLSR